MKKQPIAFQLLFTSCMLFLTLTAIGMLYYPGGTMLDHHTKGYSFFGNFISELGRWRTHNGGTKWISFYCLTFALLIQAASMFVFNLSFLKHTGSIALSPKAYYTALVSGSIFPFLLAGIAFTPCDLFLPYHMFFVRTGFALLLPLSIAYTVLIRKHDLLPNRYGNVMLSIVLAIALYLVMIFAGPDPHKIPYVQQTAQKIIVYAMIFSLLYLSVGTLKFLPLPNSVNQMQVIEELNH
jgi:hypothetical protein